MANLADDWLDSRQTCVDVLCGYLRMPHAGRQLEESPRVTLPTWPWHGKVPGALGGSAVPLLRCIRRSFRSAAMRARQVWRT